MHSIEKIVALNKEASRNRELSIKQLNSPVNQDEERYKKIQNKFLNREIITSEEILYLFQVVSYYKSINED